MCVDEGCWREDANAQKKTEHTHTHTFEEETKRHTKKNDLLQVNHLNDFKIGWNLLIFPTANAPKSYNAFLFRVDETLKPMHIHSIN